MVSLIAPAGTGKTRLLEEFLDAARARHEIGRLIGDPESPEAGRRELEWLGDIDYLDRFDPGRN